jgi:hypothetical protein
MSEAPLYPRGGGVVRSLAELEGHRGPVGRLEREGEEGGAVTGVEESTVWEVPAAPTIRVCLL